LTWRSKTSFPTRGRLGERDEAGATGSLILSVPSELALAAQIEATAG